MAHERYRAVRTVRAAISADGLVLLDVEGGLVLSANTVGARIWELLQAEQTPIEIAQRLAADYTMPLDRVERDVALFVGELMSRGLITGDPRR